MIYLYDDYVMELGIASPEIVSTVDDYVKSYSEHSRDVVKYVIFSEKTSYELTKFIDDLSETYISKCTHRLYDFNAGEYCDKRVIVFIKYTSEHVYVGEVRDTSGLYCIDIVDFDLEDYSAGSGGTFRFKTERDRYKFIKNFESIGNVE